MPAVKAPATPAHEANGVQAPARPAPKPKAPAKPAAPERPVVYPEPEVHLCVGLKALTMAKAKEMLGWVGEDEWAAQLVEQQPGTNPLTATFGNDYLLVDENGVKVRCARNDHNRPYDDAHAQKLMQEHLERGWQFNGESIIIGRHATVESGQHRLTGFVRACQRWRKDPGRYPKWPSEPTMETVVVTGVSEDPRVVMTLDNVKPRTLSDVLYTSDAFKSMKLDPRGRAEITRMLAKAVDFLWKRTGAKDAGLSYQTHSASAEFIANHKRLERAVKHVFEENQGGRAISLLRLSPGQVAGILYLMGSGLSDGDKYRAGDPRCEKGLDWSLWDDAQDFWTSLAQAEADGNGYWQCKQALAALIDADAGLGGRTNEKLAVIAKAWDLHQHKQKIDEESLRLSYVEDANGVRRLAVEDLSNFGGIDLGDEPPKAADPEESPEDIRARIAEEQAARVRASRETAGKAQLDDPTAAKPRPELPAPKPGSKPVAMADQLAEIAAQHPGKVLIQKRAANHAAWGADASTVSRVAKLPIKCTAATFHLDCVEVPNRRADEVVELLVKAGHSVLTWERVDGQTRVLGSVQAAKAKKK